MGGGGGSGRTQPPPQLPTTAATLTATREGRETGSAGRFPSSPGSLDVLLSPSASIHLLCSPPLLSASCDRRDSDVVGFIWASCRDCLVDLNEDTWVSWTLSHVASPPQA